MLIMLECLSLLFISTGRTSFPSKEHYCTTPADAHLGDAADDVRVLAGIVFLIPAEDLHLPAFQDMDLRQWERGGGLRAWPIPAGPSPTFTGRRFQKLWRRNQCRDWRKSSPPSTWRLPPVHGSPCHILPHPHYPQTPRPRPWRFRCLALSMRICLSVKP